MIIGAKPIVRNVPGGFHYRARANIFSLTENAIGFLDTLKGAGLNLYNSAVIEYLSKCTVLTKLEIALIIHFACHELSEELDPSLSCLLVKEYESKAPKHLNV
jgi:hypothetical protein